MPGLSLTQPVVKAATERPGETFTIFGDRRRTNADFADRVARFAGALVAGGVTKGDRVAMLAMNSDRYVEYVFATLWAEGVINPVNARWSPVEMAYSFQDSGTQVLLIDDTFLPILDDLRGLAPGLRRIIYVGDGETPDGCENYEMLIASHDPILEGGAAGDDMAALLYTGGTTGRPKGVMLSHEGIATCSLALTAAAPNGGDKPGLHVAPFFHIGGVGVIFQFAFRRAPQVIMPAFEPGEALRLIEAEKVADIFVVPTMLRVILDHPDMATRDLTSLVSIRYGAAPINTTLLNRAMDAIPTAGFMQVYGQTEFSPVITCLAPDDHLGEGAERRLTSAGRPLPSASVRIVDENRDPLPQGAVGEIAVRGAQTMLGYWNRPEETANTLSGGWLYTGDAGMMDEEGFLHIVDRVKDMIVTGGENVYSAEVENALATMPGVGACAVVALPDEHWGERVHAVIVPTPGAAFTLEAVRAHCKPLIAGYKAPRSISILDELPLSPAGKIQKNVLRDTLAKEA
ncbi:long-chain-fatty-acid--CoA ligase [Maritimibacter dapengensis]|uniref:Long-chain-fatty-acid--CoA ligase n=1 Tax=Maritimibacter dapengensis TaxID=2836868 RepID=A0ABS6T6C8_9RHOB|nr:long-chain-fatty-acid--CoA ligase [Maritimibacter dapengensis]MBV7380764.1 long-chain-fatty-acid--CoA ligase [Maritimibacter dapengensis]